MFELEARVKEGDFDACVVQESHLEEKSDTPSITGYKTIRADRKACKHGGLVAFVKKSLVAEDLGEVAIDATETSTFRIRMDQNNWVHISNVYVPPHNSKGQDVIRLVTDIIPALKSSLICGDLNAHTPLWDSIQPMDERGEQLVDWAMDTQLSILNDGSATRVNVGTGNGSTPDLTLCGSDLSGKVSWRVGEPIGSSDHLPIEITINSKVKHQSVFGKRAKWKTSGVNYNAFREQIEEVIEEETQGLKLVAKIIKMNEILIESAKKHIGKVKPGKGKYKVMSPSIRQKIMKRNRFRRDLKTKKKEWMEACKEVNEAIRQEKEDSWRDLLEGVYADGDEQKIWSFIKSVNGTPNTNSPNEVLTHNGKRLISNRKKADGFMSHYADVSKISFTKEDKSTNRKSKDVKQIPTVDDESCSKFTMRELKKALSKMKRKGAPGPDDIPPAFLKELGPRALGVLLDIFNESFALAECPQIWRLAIIVPLLKAGKSPKELKSFRPISLTSCVVKLLERLVAERMYYLVETRGFIHRFQAGFRKGRSCEDQILRVVQAIENGFAQKKMERSVLVLLDFSSAYDTVWKEKLLVSLHEQGIPLQIVRWLASFLNNRVARVRYGDALSSARTMRQGLPQGSVLSPLLFVLYINNLAKLLPEWATNVIFADDVSILCTHRDREEAVRMAQEAVDIVVGWSKEWKLNLNPTKSEVAFFSTWTREQETPWEPTIMIDGKRIPFNVIPKMLGVVLDTTLSFGEQVKEVTRQATEKLKLMSALAHTEWGWRKRDLMKIYLTFIRSRLDYGAAAWQPWLSETSIEKLDVVQNKAMRIASGQMSRAPVDALRFETGVADYWTIVNRMCIQAVEKAMRLPTDHPRYETWKEAVPSKNLRLGWKAKCDSLLELMPAEANERRPIEMYACPPWKERALEIHTRMPGVTSRDDPNPVKRAATITQLDSFNADFTIYTDGSATAGCEKGGAAAVVTRGPAENPVMLKEVKSKGAAFTSSYEEELSAAMMAVEWITEADVDDFCKIVIATDSQSLCSALSGASTEIERLKNMIGAIPCKLIWQWIPSHCDVTGNEWADKAANDAAKMEGTRRQISFASSKALIKKVITCRPPTHERSKLVYSKMSDKSDAAVTTRHDQVLLARIRSGWDLRFAATRHRFNENEDPSCPRCGFESEDMEHWLLQCPGTTAAKQAIFGTWIVELDVLTEFPGKVEELARRTLCDPSGSA
jgi:ribonuclease HI